MKYPVDNIDYGKTWNDITTDRYSGFVPHMSNYHMHTYYEISLILSGDVTVLLSDLSNSGIHSRIVLLRPYTPHFIISEPGVFYSRINILFSNEFIADCVPEWKDLTDLFGAKGNVVALNETEVNTFYEIAKKLEQETNVFRKRLLLLYLLSLLKEMPCPGNTGTEIPSFITEVLAYLTEHYSEKIVAAELAAHFGIGRTKLMTAFRKYTDTTLNEYLTQSRLNNAVKLMREGATVEQAAQICGYGEGCCLIRVFKKRYKVTPMEYLGKRHKTK